MIASTSSEPEVVQHLRRLGDELVLADARLELLADHLVHAVDHGAGRVEQHLLVERLLLARVEHRLLAVADDEAAAGEGGLHRRLEDVDADGHVGRRPSACRMSRISRAARSGRPASGATAPRRPIMPPRTFSGFSHGQYRRWCLAAEPKSQRWGSPPRVRSA